MNIEIEDSGWPVIVIRWPDGAVTGAAVEEFLARALVLARRGRHWNLHIASGVPSLDAGQRRRLAAHVKEHRQLLATNVAGAAVVVASPIARGLVTAVNWLAPPPFTQRVFATVVEAERWIDAERQRGN